MAEGVRNRAVNAGDEPIETVVERFEQAWRSGVPEIADFVDAADPSAVRLLRELALVDLEYRIKHDADTRIEDSLRRLPTLADDEDFLREAVRLEFSHRRRREPGLTAAEYRARFPALALSLAEPDPHATRAPAAAGGSGSSLIGADIGGVRIVRLIAEGGMGRVYEGLQERPRRGVAVKVMRPGIASTQLLKRFEYEAHVLGGLRHPGIGQIFAVGTHERDGERVPYFVMELIPGARGITAYAAAAGLPVRARLELFRQVCDAVAHGHQRGVIHRDLKPANILVDEAGNPKVIDFGVARCTGSDVALTTMQTDVGQLVGTLQYMSPEQFDADPDGIDVRCDVYSLGVVLYELVSGRLPHDLRGKPLVEMARLVREVDPPTLSTVDRGIPRDLAAIAAKCLEKDRGRRYSSASELAADVGRHLAGEAVVARPPGFVDSVARIARRHKAATAAVAAVAAALVIAVAGISFFAIRARREREVAIAERNRATEQEQATRKERDRAQGILSYLLDTFTAADPRSVGQLQQKGRDVRVVDVIEPAVEKARRDFADDPATKADVLHTLGKVLSSLGFDEAATPALLDAHATFAAVATRSPEDEVRFASSLAAVANIRDRKQEFTEAAAMHEQALAIRERILGPGHPDTVRSLMEMGHMYHEQKGSLDRAEAYFRRALEAGEKYLGPAHQTTIDALHNMASIRQIQARFDEAEEMYAMALARAEEALGPEHLNVAIIANNLSAIHHRLQKYSKAEQLLRRSLAIHEKVYGARHPSTAIPLTNLATMLCEQGQVAKAEPIFRQVLEVVESSYGPDHSETARAIENLAKAREALGRASEAQTLLERAIGIREQDDRPRFRESLADALYLLGVVYSQQKQFARVGAVLTRAADLFEQMHGSGHQKTIAALVGCGAGYEAQGLFDQAEVFLRKALAGAEQAHGADDPRTLMLMERVAAACARQEKYGEAAELLQTTVAAVERRHGPRHPNVLRLKNVLAETNRRAAVKNEAGVAGLASPTPGLDDDE